MQNLLLSGEQSILQTNFVSLPCENKSLNHIFWTLHLFKKFVQLLRKQFFYFIVTSILKYL